MDIRDIWCGDEVHFSRSASLFRRFGLRAELKFNLQAGVDDRIECVGTGTGTMDRVFEGSRC